MIDKDTARKRGKQARAALGADMRAAYDARIIAHCQTKLAWADYERVMLFLPIERQHEINTWPLVRWIWATWPAAEVYVPRVEAAEMAAVRITPLTKYLKSGLGINEPMDGDILEREPLDLILAPLLGFDLSGNRVGYGKGYYDKFFATKPMAERIGLGYECLLIPGLAAEAHDIKLTAAITEERFYDF